MNVITPFASVRTLNYSNPRNKTVANTCTVKPQISLNFGAAITSEGKDEILQYSRDSVNKVRVDFMEALYTPNEEEENNTLSSVKYKLEKADKNFLKEFIAPDRDGVSLLDKAFDTNSWSCFYVILGAVHKLDKPDQQEFIDNLKLEKYFNVDFRKLDRNRSRMALMVLDEVINTNPTKAALWNFDKSFETSSKFYDKMTKLLYNENVSKKDTNTMIDNYDGFLGKATELKEMVKKFKVRKTKGTKKTEGSN